MLNSPAQVGTYWREQLYDKVDGRALATVREVPAVSTWVTRPNPNMSGEEYVRAIKTRAGVITTPARSSRSRNGDRGDPLCKRDRQRATLNHISQVCQTTHGLRVKRHNNICEMLTATLRKDGWTTWAKPRIPVGATFIKPDIIAVKGSEYCVLDPIITGDNQEIELSASGKSNIYDQDAIERVRQGLEWNDEEEITGQIAGVAFNIRGAIAKTSYLQLRNIGVRPDYIKWMSVRVLVSTYKLVSSYVNATG